MRIAVPAMCRHLGLESLPHEAEELVPTVEREGIDLHVEPHPEDWCETIQPAADVTRAKKPPRVKSLYCAPHTSSPAATPAPCCGDAPVCWRDVHVGDTFDKASSGLRYTLDPPSTRAREHRHLDIGQDEVRWDDVFGTLAEVGFDGIVTSCVFA